MVDASAGDLKKSSVVATVGNDWIRTRQVDEVPPVEQVSALTGVMAPETELAVLSAAWCSLRVFEVNGLLRGDLKNLEQLGKASLIVERQWPSKVTLHAYGAPKDDRYRAVAVSDLLAK